MKRRDFMTAAGASMLCAPALAQNAPLSLTISPTEQTAIVNGIPLPGRMEGNFEIPEEYWARVVKVRAALPAGEIHILPQNKHLYFTLGNGEAIRYGCAIGQEGLAYFGTAVIGRKVEWPSWTPTPEMIKRNPAAYEKYADGMPGGPTNPLGARALYFYENGRDTAIRIHGTVSPASIGSASSNGCFRMYNSHVIDLYKRVPLGTVAHAY